MKDQILQERITRRQQKHHLLVTFMANMEAKKPGRPAPVTPKLKALLLSLFARPTMI